MIRRTFLSLLFAILFVFAQQEAMLHPYVHTADLQQKSTSDKQAPKHSEVCGKCEALANIGSAVGSESQTVHVLNATFEFSSFSIQPFISAHFQPYHSRAPPYLA